MSHRTPLSFASSLAFAVALGAQGGPKIQRDATTLVVPAGRYEIAPLIDEFAVFLQWNVLYDRAALARATGPLEAPATGPLEVPTRLLLDRATAEEALCEFVYSRGFLIHPRDPERQLYEAVAMPGPPTSQLVASAPTRSPLEILRRPNLMRMVMTTFEFENVDVVAATNALRPFLASKGGRPLAVVVATTADLHSLMLAGTQPDVARTIERLLQIDGREPTATALEPSAAPDAAPAPNRVETTAAPRALGADLRVEIAGIRRSIETLNTRLGALENRAR